MNKKLINQWTNNIRSHADAIDKHLEWNEQPESETQKQLDYVLKRMGHLQDRFHSIIVKTGRGESYVFEVENGERVIKEINKEIELWRTEGIVPEVLEGPK